jgi:hypothetical protein
MNTLRTAWVAAMMLALGACGGGDSGSGGGPGFGAGCSANTIANIANHGHALTVPAVDVSAGLGKSYSIRGSADHDHTVTFTSQQMRDLAGGSSVTLTSTQGTNAADGAHVHAVTTRC